MYPFLQRSLTLQFIISVIVRSSSFPFNPLHSIVHSSLYQNHINIIYRVYAKRRHIQTHLWNRMTVEEDAKAYHAFVSAAVDIASVDVTSYSPSKTRHQVMNDASNQDTKCIPTDDIIQTISFITSSRDLDTNSRRSFLHTVSLATFQSKHGENYSFLLPTHSMPMELPTKIKVRCVSPSGKKVALLMEENDSSSTSAGSTITPTTSTGKRDVLEIWSYLEDNKISSSSSWSENEVSTFNTMSLIHRIVLPTKKIHGKLLTDSVLNGPMSLSWNHDETCISYCAERLPTKACSFFQREKEEKLIVGGEYTRGIGKVEEYGEALAGINPLIDIYIVHVRYCLKKLCIRME